MRLGQYLDAFGRLLYRLHHERLRYRLRVGHADPGRVQRAGQRDLFVDEGLPDRVPERDDQLQPVGIRGRGDRVRAKQVDFAGSDFPLAATDQPTADARCGSGNKAINIPLVPGAIAVMYNLSGVSGQLNLSAATIAKIFNGKITTWNDPAIAKDKPGVSLPSTKITTFHRADKSGTSYNFSNFLNQSDHTDFPAAANKQWPGSGGQGENGSSGVAQAVKTTAGGIGYAEISFAQSNKLSTAKVGNAQGHFVDATTANASAFIAKAKVTQNGSDLQLAFDYTYADPAAYPAVLVTYEIACAAGNDPAQLALIKDFLTYAAGTTAQAELPAAGYVQLPSNIQSQIQTSITSLK